MMDKSRYHDCCTYSLANEIDYTISDLCKHRANIRTILNEQYHERGYHEHFKAYYDKIDGFIKDLEAFSDEIKV